MKEVLESFCCKEGFFPPLPEIHSEVEREIQNPRFSRERVSSIINKESDFASYLLTLANSGLYHLPQRAGTVRQVLQSFDLGDFKNLALAAAILSSFKDIPGKLIPGNSFWQHSISCGVAAHLLAREQKLPNPEAFFLRGLLHDTGRLLMYLKLPEESRKILSRGYHTGERISVVEMKMLGFDHAELGGVLLEGWRLPPVLVEAARFHHQPTQSQRAPVEVALVHIADFLVNSLELGSSGERFVPPLSKESWEQSGLDPDCLPQVIDNLEEQAGHMCRLLIGLN